MSDNHIDDIFTDLAFALRGEAETLCLLFGIKPDGVFARPGYQVITILKDFRLIGVVIGRAFARCGKKLKKPVGWLDPVK